MPDPSPFTSPWVAVSLAVFLGYAMGSFPTSIIVGRVLFKTDPREHGSGNAGGTNTFRLFGWRAGLFVSSVDVGKGVLAALMASAIGRLGAGSAFPGGSEGLALVAGLAAVAGHVWSMFAGFRGGKGVATAAGVLLALAPLPSAAAALVFASLLFTTGIVSLASMSAAVSLAIAATLMRLAGLPTSIFVVVFCWMVAPFILFTHRANIRRLLKGQENSFERLRLVGKRRTGE